MGGDAGLVEGHHGSQAVGLGGELHLVAPGSADAVNAAAVGTHLNGVGGVVVEAGEGVGVGVNVSEVILVAIEAELPSGGAAVLGPAQLHAVGGGLANESEASGSRAGDISGEALHVTLKALGIAGALALHVHLIQSLGIEVLKGHIGRGGVFGPPLASRNHGADGHIIEVEVVVISVSLRVGEESDISILACIGAEVNAADRFTSIGDFIQHVCGAAVVPFAQDGPCGHIVSRNQHSESVCGASHVCSST